MIRFQYFLALALLVLLKNSFAQANFLDGYIILKTGDTLKGKIKDRNDPRDTINEQKITFFSSDEKRKRYKAKSLIGYHTENGDFRTINTLNKGKNFALIVEDGKVILYKFYVIDQQASQGGMRTGVTSYVAVPTGGGYMGMMGMAGGGGTVVFKPDYYIQKKGDEKSMSRVPTLYLKMMLTKFFKDEPEFVKKIEINPPQYTQIRKLIQEYNSSDTK